MNGPTWASVNLGVFMCITCSGVHRSLGVHISKVRSITLDTWLPEQVDFVLRMGNVRANAYWEAQLPPGIQKSRLQGDSHRLQDFIRQKYCSSAFAAPGAPPTAENVRSGQAALPPGPGGPAPEAAPSAAPAPAAPAVAQPLRPPPGSAPTPAAASAPAPAATAPAVDNSWDAFAEAASSIPSAPVPAPAPAPAAADGGWAAFGEAPLSAGGSGFSGADPFAAPAAPATGFGGADPFAAAAPAPVPAADPFAAAAAPAPAPAADPFAAAGAAPSAAPSAAGSGAPAKSAAISDIMGMFDQPGAAGGGAFVTASPVGHSAAFALPQRPAPAGVFQGAAGGSGGGWAGAGGAAPFGAMQQAPAGMMGQMPHQGGVPGVQPGMATGQALYQGGMMVGQAPPQGGVMMGHAPPRGGVMTGQAPPQGGVMMGQPGLFGAGQNPFLAQPQGQPPAPPPAAAAPSAPDPFAQLGGFR